MIKGNLCHYVSAYLKLPSNAATIRITHGDKAECLEASDKCIVARATASVVCRRRLTNT